MAKVIELEIFVHLNLNYSHRLESMPQLAISTFNADMTGSEHFSEYVMIEKKTISVLVPSHAEIANVAAESLEKELSAMRARHHQEQQQIIDKIASYRLLAAPNDGELVDDADLRDVSRSLFNKARANDVSEADYTDMDDIPF